MDPRRLYRVVYLISDPFLGDRQAIALLHRDPEAGRQAAQVIQVVYDWMPNAIVNETVVRTLNSLYQNRLHIWYDQPDDVVYGEVRTVPADVTDIPQWLGDAARRGSP